MILYLAGGVQANIKFCWQSLLTAIGGQTCKYIWQEHKGAGGALMNILGGAVCTSTSQDNTRGTRGAI